METRFRDLAAREYWNLTWPFFVSLIVGAVVRYLSSLECFPYWLPNDFISGVADALMVAGILGPLLELFATRLLIEKVSDKLAEKLVGRGLPAELQSLIKGIVNTDIVRDHYEKVYELCPTPDSERMLVTVTLSFEAKNYSDSVVNYAPSLQDENIYEPELLTLEYGLRGQQPLTEMAPAEVDPITKVRTTKGKKTVKLEPIRRNEQATCDIVMRYQLNMPNDYSDVTSFGGATEGATLRVKNIPQGFDVVCKGENRRTNHVNGDKSWYFDRPFIVNQHIRIWWYKKQQV